MGKSEPSHVKLSREIGTQIVTGAYAPGDLLPSEVDLARDFDVSRNVVREALRMLSVRGLIHSRPKVGTRVLERESWQFLNPMLLEWMFSSTPPPDFVKQLFELRRIVEPSAARIAAARRTPRHLATMGHALEEMSRHSLASKQGQLADQEFHNTLLKATDNELLLNLSAGIGAAVRWTTHFKYSSARKPKDPIDEHRSLFDAIADQDGDRAFDCALVLVEAAERDTDAALSIAAGETV